MFIGKCPYEFLDNLINSKTKTTTKQYPSCWSPKTEYWHTRFDIYQYLSWFLLGHSDIKNSKVPFLGHPWWFTYVNQILPEKHPAKTPAKHLTPGGPRSWVKFSMEESNMYLEEWACDRPSPCRRDKGVGSGHLPGRVGFLCVGSYKGFLPKNNLPNKKRGWSLPLLVFCGFILCFFKGGSLKKFQCCFLCGLVFFDKGSSPPKLPNHKRESTPYLHPSDLRWFKVNLLENPPFLWYLPSKFRFYMGFSRQRC